MEFVLTEMEFGSPEMESVLTEMEFVLTEMESVLTEMEFVLTEMEFVLTEMEFVLTEMESVLTEMEFVLTESEFGRQNWKAGHTKTVSCPSFYYMEEIKNKQVKPKGIIAGRSVIPVKAITQGRLRLAGHNDGAECFWYYLLRISVEGIRCKALLWCSDTSFQV
jgi:hypothetical protein